MGENSKISWTDHTFNPWWGCTKVSAGCKNCYAEAMAKRTGNDCFGSSPRRMLSEANWRKPLKWNKRAAASGVRERVFCGSMCDVFEGLPELGDPLARLMETIDATPALDWLVLTKHPHRMAILSGHALGIGLRWPQNAWALTTTENQEAADERIPHLLNVPATVRGLSVEPMLGPVVFNDCHVCGGSGRDDSDGGACHHCASGALGLIDWVIAGCESGAKRRPSELKWFRDLRDQCREAGVAFFCKQLEINGKVTANVDDFPADLRVREFPR